MTKPIEPSEVADKKAEGIPSFVIEAFNQLIAKNYNSGSAKVTQTEAVNKIVELSGTNEKEIRGKIFENHWLDVEDIYRKAGWTVEFDKAGYCENYDSFFIFGKRRIR